LELFNVKYIPHQEGGMLSKHKIKPTAGRLQFPSMDRRQRPEIENLATADNIESSMQSMILFTMNELCLPTGKLHDTAKEISILQLEVEASPIRIALADWQLNMDVSQIVLIVMAGS
jgi:hypothetical protein